jgi:hypothetical protein
MCSAEAGSNNGGDDIKVIHDHARCVSCHQTVCVSVTLTGKII